MQVVFENVTKEFSSRGKAVKAVNGLSLSIKSGTLFGFLGPSGCGKSTSLFMISGIHDLTSGHILFDNKDVSNLAPEKRGVGMVFQNYALYPHLSVRENIEFPLVNSTILSKQLKRQAKELQIKFMDLVDSKVKEVAKVVEITEYLYRKPSELSGGQQQRVAIARALVKEPSILLLDEPLSNLDARLRVQTRDEIRRIQRETGITTVFVTHDQEEALNICDEIAILDNGTLQQVGQPQQVYDHPCNIFVAKFLGSFPINILNSSVKDGNVCIGTMKVGRTTAPDGGYRIGIRPENLLPDDDGNLRLTLTSGLRHGGIETVEGTTSDGQRVRFVKNPSMYDIRFGASISLRCKKDSLILFNDNGETMDQC